MTYAATAESVAAVAVAADPLYDFTRGDVADRDLLDQLLAEFQATAVVHLAAESHVDRSIRYADGFIATNVVGTFTLLEAIRSHRGDDEGPRLLHVSTDEVFGSLDASGRFSETSPYNPSSPY